MSAVSNSSELENKQAKPPRADTAAASSDIRAAWGFRLRIESMPQIICRDGKREVTARLYSGRNGLRAYRRRNAGGLAPPVLQRQRQLFGGLDAIAAGALGLIERGVGRRQQHFEFGAGRTTGHPDADGGIDRTFLAYDTGG